MSKTMMAEIREQSAKDLRQRMTGLTHSLVQLKMDLGSSTSLFRLLF